MYSSRSEKERDRAGPRDTISLRHVEAPKLQNDLRAANTANCAVDGSAK